MGFISACTPPEFKTSVLNDLKSENSSSQEDFYSICIPSDFAMLKPNQHSDLNEENFALKNCYQIHKKNFNESSQAIVQNNSNTSNEADTNNAEPKGQIIIQDVELDIEEYSAEKMGKKHLYTIMEKETAFRKLSWRKNVKIIEPKENAKNHWKVLLKDPPHPTGNSNMPMPETGNKWKKKRYSNPDGTLIPYSEYLSRYIWQVEQDQQSMQLIKERKTFKFNEMDCILCHISKIYKKSCLYRYHNWSFFIFA